MKRKYIKTYNSWRNISSYLLEGRADDLVIKFPELKPAYDAGITNYQYLNWMRKHANVEPVNNIISVVQAFDKRKDMLKSKGLSTDIYTYRSPGILRQTIKDLGTSRSEKSRRLKTDEATHLGTFGDWNVWLPLTTEASCELGKSTTWCTAGTDTDNAFFDIVTRVDLNGALNLLYYIIRSGADSRKDPTAKLAVGFLDGEPTLAHDSGSSVDSENESLDKTRLMKILGNQYSPIMSVMKDTYWKLDGEHPLSKKQRDAADPNTPKKVLAELATDSEARIKDIIIDNPNVPSEALAELSMNKTYEIRVKVARNPNTPVEVLVKLSRDQTWDVRREVAANPNTPVETLVELSRDDQVSYGKWVRSAVARNTNAPVDILVELSRDKVERVRQEVAMNPNTPVDILVKLSRSKEEAILREVATNPKTPKDIADALTARYPPHAPRPHDIYFANKTSPEVLSKLSKMPLDDMNDETNVVILVAGNPNTPVEDLERLSTIEVKRIGTKLSHYGVESIHNQLVWNPSSTTKILVKLSMHKWNLIREKAIRRLANIDDAEWSSMTSEEKQSTEEFIKSKFQSDGLDESVSTFNYVKSFDGFTP